jgi:hypothetical protein
MEVLRRILALGIALAAVSGCATDDTHSTGVGATFDPLTMFPASATWAWDDAANRLPKDERIRSLDFDAIIKEVVPDEFAARGYVQASAAAPDYLLSYDLRMNTWISQTEARSIGSLSLLMVEAESGRRVWLGFIRAEMDMSNTRESRKEFITKELRKLLKDFPPSQRK